MKNSRETFAALAAAVMMTLAIASPAAFAQSSQDAYIQEGPSVVDRTDANDGNGSGNDNGSASSGSLPFTGVDLGLMGVAGGSLLLIGLGMRRLTRSAPPA